MITQYFEIPDRLAGWNEIHHAAGSHWAKAYRIKKEDMERVRYWTIKHGVEAVEDGAEVHIMCYEPTLRRDRDNVESGAKKIILDALQNIGILRNDNRKGLGRCLCEVMYDKEKPRVEVTIKGKLTEKHR